MYAAPPHMAAATSGSPASARAIPALLFVTILASPFVFVEPSPYEGVVALFAIACLVLGVRVDVRLLPLLILLVAWAVGGLVSLIPVSHDGDAVVWMAVSIYLQITALIFACVFAEDTARRMAVLRTAYILAALFAAMLGVLGYFGVLPMTDVLLEAGRARATFKDPNVYGPFLILPLLFLIQSMLDRGLRLRYLAGFAIILTGLFVSFSRGAWGHFVASAMLMVWLMVVTAPSARHRARIVGLATAAAVAVAGLVAAMLTFDVVGEMFVERASLVQSYDTGEGGRFTRQAEGLSALLDRPNGFGPEQFGKELGQAPHNVYMNAFAAYGWLGGFSYATLIVLTLLFGFRGVLVRTPWQTPFIAAYSTFVALAAEGFIIDTDHWRHFFLLLGLVWGLIAASERARGAQSARTAAMAGPVSR